MPESMQIYKFATRKASHLAAVKMHLMTSRKKKNGANKRCGRARALSGGLQNAAAIMRASGERPRVNGAADRVARDRACEKQHSRKKSSANSTTTGDQAAEARARALCAWRKKARDESAARHEERRSRAGERDRLVVRVVIRDDDDR